MVIYRTFDELFSTWSNVAVLRTLIDTKNGFTGNEVARVSGMHPNSAIKALTNLENLGIINRQIGGRDHIFTLNREHFLTKEVLLKIFQLENKFLEEIVKELSLILKKQVYSAVIFGSVARKEENINSDIDICCIVNLPIEKINLIGLFNNKSKIMYEKFGVKLATLIFLKDEFIRKRKTKLVKEIVDEGILITGKHPKVLING